MTEIITGVAILTHKGALWALPRPHRHCHIFALAAFTSDSAEHGTQGFVTNTGHFVDRMAARKIAEIAGQVEQNGSHVLYSEDLW